MRRKEDLPELLAPAGSFECLVAAVEAGADAVYVGGKRFGARAYAKNFDTEELGRAVSYCHLHGVKLYITLNTLIFDKEMADAVEYAKELYRIGVDALIIADLGAVRAIKKCVPSLPLHASTQMSIHNSAGVLAAEKMGLERAVVARELPLSDIKKIVESTGAEIEVFLHGALCVCHSGQCLFSSMVGGRSGNRGECAQPCRLPYNGKYPLSLRDLSLSEHITELIDSGVCSLKIEGRMKSPDYVYTVTSIYRRLLDEHRNSKECEREELRNIFSRGGFTDGYFVGDIKKKMTGMRTEEDKKNSVGLERTYEIKKKRVRQRCVIELGKPSYLELSDGERTVSVFGEIANPAQSSPLTEESVKERLAKLGNTLLYSDKGDISLTLDRGVNLSPSAINALRRSAAQKFEDFSREYSDIPYTPETSGAYSRFDTALFLSEKAFLELPSQLPLHFDAVLVPLFSGETALKKANGVYLPPIIFEGELSEVRAGLERARELGLKFALVGNIGAAELAKDAGFIPVGDFRLNITNSESAAYYKECGVENFILSAELTLPMARDIGGGLFSYGRIPLMITERCFMEENFSCENCGRCSLTDRYGERFPLMREFKHRNLILNSKVTYVGDRADELKKYRIRSKHFLFTTETASEVLSAMNAFSSGRALGEGVRRVGKRKSNKK